ncbi:hypothetical protein AB4160_13140 [Shewanella sp. 10N.286.51.B8]|uniref:hypothetical protein n=1 Tax=Shewanella sp. 10N.286.51.B8 TaxID=3229708 RepID=UPI00354E8EEA
MGKSSSIAKKNRQRNAGGVMPDPIKIATALIKLFSTLNNRNYKKVNKEKFLVVIIYLWLTQRLTKDKTNDKNAKPADFFIPDCIRVTGSEECQEHAFRTVKDGSHSWAEYAQPYPTKQGEVFLWQPIPKGLNALFRPFISKQRYNTPWLSRSEINLIIEILTKKWRKSTSVIGFPSARKDKLFNYFTNCIQVDNELSSMSKYVLLREHKLHHRNAKAYQSEDSDRIRYRIYQAHERYLEHIFTQVRLFNWEAMLSIKSSNKEQKSELYLINKHRGQSLPDELIEEGRIAQLRKIQYQGGTEERADIPIQIGSSKVLQEHEVTHFFASLHDEIIRSKPVGKVELSQHIEYYNLCTYHLALLFVFLTGVRPTHEISIEKERCYRLSTCAVSDKGRLRQIILCDYFSQQLRHYLSLQRSLSTHLSSSFNSPYLWYLCDPSEQACPLTAKKLKLFMHDRLKNKTPYMLRHTFAQCALTSVYPIRLTTSQIDRLMGHSEYGEHFGSDHLFPANLTTIKQHLNSLASRFDIKEVCYV